MSEHDMDTQLRSWARSASGRPAPGELRRQVLDIPATPRRRRWLSFLPQPKPTAGADAGREQTQPPTNEERTPGPAPGPQGGIHTMFSATKMVGLAATVALIGSVMLVAVPLGGTQDATVPAATVDEPSAISAFSGTMELLDGGQAGAIERHDWGVATLDRQVHFEYDVDDPRLRGDGRLRLNEYDIKGLARGPNVATVYIEDDEGSWTGGGPGYRGPEDAGYHFQSTLTGHGAYEGLTALLTGDQAYYGAPFEIEGVVIEGPLPPLPEPADEIE